MHLCERFGGWPDAGGLLDQSAGFLRQVALVDLARSVKEGETGGG